MDATDKLSHWSLCQLNMQKYAGIHEKSRLFRKMDVHTQLSDLVTNITLISKQEFNLASVDNKYTFIQMFYLPSEQNLSSKVMGIFFCRQVW